MPLLVINADLKEVATQLRRIADKLEEIWPTIPPDPVEMVKESDVVNVREIKRDGAETEMWEAYAPRSNYDK